MNKKPDEKQSEKAIKKPIKEEENKFSNIIAIKETDINNKTFKKCFAYQKPTDILKYEYITKKTDKLTNVINSGFFTLINKIR